MALRLQSAPKPVGNPNQRGSLSASGEGLGDYLEECRSLVLNEIGSITPRTRYGHRLYELMEVSLGGAAPNITVPLIPSK